MQLTVPTTPGKRITVVGGAVAHGKAAAAEFDKVPGMKFCLVLDNLRSD